MTKIRKSTKRVKHDAGAELRKLNIPKKEAEFAGGILAVVPRKKKSSKK